MNIYIGKRIISVNPHTRPSVGLLLWTWRGIKRRFGIMDGKCL